MAERIGCGAYYYYAEGKEEVLKEFRREGRIIIAISTFGIRIDIADIWVIIHINILRSLLDYAQESGHIRRNRLGNEAIIIIDP